MRLTNYVSTAGVGHLQPIRYWRFGRLYLMMQLVSFHDKVRPVSFPSSLVRFSMSVPADWDKHASGINKCQEGLEMEAERRSGGHVQLQSELNQEFSPLNKRFSFINYTNNGRMFLTQNYTRQITSWRFVSRYRVVNAENIKSSWCNMPASFWGGS